MSITVTNLSKTYGEQKAVNRISFTINKGEIVGFLGPNGAGKSTTMKMITGFLKSDEGEIKVCGVIADESNLQAKKKIGYLPEANPLYMDMYVREYLGFMADIHDSVKGSERKITTKKSRIEEVIKTVGLTPESGKKIGQLSKGYKQRVGLAAALIHDPEVLILDEPTSGLDPNQIVEIRSVIRSLSKNKTVLFSSHIMQEVEAICDRVIIINKGNIVADDSVSNLQKSSPDSHVVAVEFNEPVSAALLNTVSGIQNIQHIPPSMYKITCTDPESVRKQLLQLSIEHNLNIVSLQSERQSLENIFKALTT
ncbi:MAG: gliding motility-associated ABC transporter ATP-binding subunit GldA [Ferruginibacter sp.]